ncbi:MAG: hypothetical protein JO041_15080 [Acidobacteria bacterium]|nr:hypothetical protein [Acidobacteriota bacterium]
MKVFTAICAAALLIPGAAFAQSGTSQTGQSSTNPGTSQSQSQTQGSQSQSGSSMGSQSSSLPQSSASESSQANSGQQQTLEGCVTKKETDYFITPDNGSAIRLRGSQDLASAEGHRARITGHYGNETASATAGTSQSSPGSTGGSSNSQALPQSGSANAGAGSGTATASVGQDFLVTEVQATSTTCPSGSQGTGSSQPPQ